MTPAEATAFRAGLEAAAKVAEAQCRLGRYARNQLLEQIAADIRAIPAPEAVKPTEDEVDLALDAYWLTPTWRKDADIAKGQRGAMRAALLAARGQP